MIWSENFLIFKPKVPRSHDEYGLKILIKHHTYFESFSSSYSNLADQETLEVLLIIMNSVSSENLRPFSLASQQEISEKDREFVLRIVKLDPRDRPTARELLENK